jgi:hypothetical protein
MERRRSLRDSQRSLKKEWLRVGFKGRLKTLSVQRGFYGLEEAVSEYVKGGV